MIYLLAIIFPPLAVLLKGKAFSAILNFILTLFFWIPGIIHAFMIISHVNAENRHRETLSVLKNK